MQTDATYRRAGMKLGKQPILLKLQVEPTGTGREPSRQPIKTASKLQNRYDALAPSATQGERRSIQGVEEDRRPAVTKFLEKLKKGIEWSQPAVVVPQNLIRAEGDAGSRNGSFCSC